MASRFHQDLIVEDVSQGLLREAGFALQAIRFERMADGCELLAERFGGNSRLQNAPLCESRSSRDT